MQLSVMLQHRVRWRASNLGRNHRRLYSILQDTDGEPTYTRDIEAGWNARGSE